MRHTATFSKETTNRLNAAGADFHIGIMEYLMEKDPTDMDIVAELADLYTRSGRIEAGLAMDIKLVGHDPANPIAHYNLACSYSLTKQAKASLDELEMAIKLGYTDADHILNDPDLTNVRSNPRFKSLHSGIQR